MTSQNTVPDPRGGNYWLAHAPHSGKSQRGERSYTTPHWTIVRHIDLCPAPMAAACSPSRPPPWRRPRPACGAGRRPVSSAPGAQAAGRSSRPAGRAATPTRCWRGGRPAGRPGARARSPPVPPSPPGRPRAASAGSSGRPAATGSSRTARRGWSTGGSGPWGAGTPSARPGTARRHAPARPQPAEIRNATPPWPRRSRWSCWLVCLSAGAFCCFCCLFLLAVSAGAALGFHDPVARLVDRRQLGEANNLRSSLTVDHWDEGSTNSSSIF